jgi:hypothetical protein
MSQSPGRQAVVLGHLRRTQEFRAVCLRTSGDGLEKRYENIPFVNRKLFAAWLFSTGPAVPRFVE